MNCLRRVLCCIALAVACAGWGVHAREVPIEDYFKDPEFSNVTLSPDGRHMTITVPSGDRTVLAVLRVADRQVVGRFDYGADRHFRQVWWVNNERLLFNLTFKTGRFDFEVPRGDLYAANIDGSRRVDIPNGNTYQVVQTLRDGSSDVIVQRSVENAFLFKLNTVNGRTNVLAQSALDSGSFLLDHEHRVRYVTGEMSDGREIVQRRDGDRWTTVHEQERSGDEFEPMWFAGDNRRVYVLASEGGAPASVWLMDIESGERTAVSSNPNVAPSDFLLSSDRRTVLAVRYDDGLPSWEFVARDHPESAVFAGLVNAFEDRMVDFIDVTADGRYVGLRVFSDTAPAEVYLFDRQSGQASFLVSSMEWIRPEEMASVRPVQFTARDGRKIHGYLTLPKGRDPKSLPLIVNPHGGPHGIRDYWGFNPETQLFANRGYAVLQVNYRGSGGYGNDFLRAGYRNWGTSMQDDLTDAVRWTVSQGIADGNRVCIYGASYGGYAALMSAVREPDLYRCTVGYVGVYSLPMMKQKGDIPGSAFGRSYLNDVLPSSSAELQAQSPAYQVERIRAPIMLVHGAKDQRVPIAQMNFLVSQLQASGKAAEDTVVEPREGHGFRDVGNNVKLYTRMLAFFDHHIGEDAVPR